MVDKFVEEINSGDALVFNKEYYLMTMDYKKNGDRLCISLIDGKPRWLKSNDIVNQLPLYTIDKDANIIAIKESKSDVENQTSNIH